VLDPYSIKSPAWIVPGLDALTGKLPVKSKYFSLPFSSFILMLIGNFALNAVTVALFCNVAVKTLGPIVILSFIESALIILLKLLTDAILFLLQALT
jgi:hypothetical protein